jgi:hypothetical protein
MLAREENDYCAVFGLSLRRYNKVTVISVLVLVLLINTSKQGHTIFPPDY